MKRFRIHVFIFFFFGFLTNSFSQYIQVDPTKTPQQLVQDILINSPCATVSNFSASGSNSFGYFTAGTSGFPFADGIILSTGQATSAIGPNNSILSDDGAGWTGDVDLQNALGISGTLNATLLEFDFLPLTDKISFEYIFASEQYLSSPSSSQCGYTDGFVFLLKKANTADAYQNLAIVPGTTLPVTVSNIRGSGTICPAQNEQYFDAFNGVQNPTNFNGQTKTLVAKSDVTAGILYHIKLVISDQGNEKYDSAIFLKGGSFNIGTNLGVDKLVANQNPLCQGEVFTLNATQASATSYKWFKNGNPILNLASGLPITTPTYQVISSGTYKVEVTINALCTSEDEIVLEYITAPTVIDTDLFQCDDNLDGLTTYDLTKINTIVTGNDSQLSIVNYFTNLLDAQGNANQIVYPRSFTNTSVNQIVYVRIKNQFNCVAFAKVTLKISNTSVSPRAVDFCDKNDIQDGITELSQLDFSIISTQLLTNLPSGLVVTYHTTYDKALLQLDAISLSFINSTPFQQVIFAAIANGSNCYGVVPVTLNINSFSPSGFETKIVSICAGVPQTILAPSGYASYVWTPANASSTNQISVGTSGIYSVEVTNNKGCKATKTFQVETSEKAQIQNITVNDFNGNSNTVFINYSGNGDYEFSLDGINFQDSNYFTDVPSAEYNLVINDKKGCGVTKADFFVLSYPTFFTPNGDGYNDVWKIQNIATRPNSRIELYNRFGKLLGNFDTDTGWNGKFNQQQLPADDYWFVLTLENQKQIKGHFALKR